MGSTKCRLIAVAGRERSSLANVVRAGVAIDELVFECSRMGYEMQQVIHDLTDNVRQV